MAAFKSQVVSSLVNNCLENISRRLTLHEDFFDLLPHDVKSKLIKKLAMRGLLRDRHLQKVCQSQISNMASRVCLHCCWTVLITIREENYHQTAIIRIMK